MNFFLVNYYLVTFGIVTDRQADRRTGGKRHIRAHRALAQVGSKMHFCLFYLFSFFTARLHLKGPDKIRHPRNQLTMA